MGISDIMSVRLVTVGPAAAVAEAAALMVSHRVGSVLVMEGGKLAGILTERDVLNLAAQGLDLKSMRVGDVASDNVVTASPDVDVPWAARLMLERGIRHLPVCQGENVMGMVSMRDVTGWVFGVHAMSKHPQTAAEAEEILRAILRGRTSAQPG